MKKLTTFVLALMLGTSSFAALKSQLTGPVFKDIAHFTQTVTLRADGTGTSTPNLIVGPVASSKSGFGIGTLKTGFSHTDIAVEGCLTQSCRGTMEVMSYDNPSSQADALAKASVWVKKSALPFKNSFASWLAKNGISMGIINYNQDVNILVGGVPKLQKLYFNMTVDSSGRAIYGAPRLVDKTPSMLEIAYISKRQGAGLPDSYKHAEGGALKYRIVDLLPNGELAEREWFTVNTGGAYDEPLPDANGAVDPNKLLRCLMNKTSSGDCPQQFPDVATLMSSNGVIYSYVNYIRGATPQYKKAADGSEQAVVKVEYTSRVWTCDALTNVGAYGVAIEFQGDYYLTTLKEGVAEYQVAATQRYRQDTQLPGRLTGLANSVEFSRVMTAAEVGNMDPDAIVLPPAEFGAAFWTRSAEPSLSVVQEIAPLIQPISNPVATIAPVYYPWNARAGLSEGGELDNYKKFYVTYAEDSTTFFQIPRGNAQRINVLNSGPGLVINGTAIGGGVSGDVTSLFGAGNNSVRAVGAGTAYFEIHGLCNTSAPNVSYLAQPDPCTGGRSSEGVCCEFGAEQVGGGFLGEGIWICKIRYGGSGGSGHHGGCSGCSPGSVTSGDGSSVSSGDGSGVSSNSGP